MIPAYLVLTLDHDGTRRVSIYSEFPLAQWSGRNERQSVMAVEHGRDYHEARQALLARLRRQAARETPTTASGELDSTSGASRGLVALAAMAGIALVAVPLAAKLAK